MKFMKLGTRPDTFYSSDSQRSVYTEVATDLQILVGKCLYHLHKFPLLSKCLLLQALCAESGCGGDGDVIELAGFPGGAEAFEELGLTSRCVDAVADLIANPAVALVPAKSTSASPWWAHDVAELGVDMFWRIMVAVKSTGAVNEKTIGDALKTYARRWLPNVAKDGLAAEQPFDDAVGASVKQITTRHRLLLEKIVSLLPVDKDAVSCAFLLKLLKAANILSASPASKAELVRRVAWQLEEASVSDLLIPSVSCMSDMLYDVDAVAAILHEFALRHAAATAPARSPDDNSPARSDGHRRSRSDESVGFDGARRSSSAAPVSQYALARVGRLVDAFLMEVAKDPHLPVEKLLAIAEAVPDSARPEHDGLYKVVDSYLKAHPEMSKSARKRLCRVINCRRLSEKACSHAAQNELLPLRVVVQVLFFEHARAAALSGAPVAGELPSNIKALLSKSGSEEDDADRVDEQRLRALASGASPGDDWSVEGLRRAASKIATLRMKMEEDDEDDEEFVRKAGLSRSASLRFRAFCAMPAGNPKRMLSKLWPLGRSVSADRH
ncbi:unnamed protein product [Triticum turgidum subsp. durum]|uniref:NPH3 domain-containing protein n=1 Tax=Triticum turgidum subsp. durum TaxID=4567 RepID=A0A9R1BB21_TRITD|nr:unnamed protein product [Triticum turgidum subsp. durum]